MELKKMKFIAACMDYFGRQPNQTLAQFQAEIRALNGHDREELKKLFVSVGYEIVE